MVINNVVTRTDGVFSCSRFASPICYDATNVKGDGVSSCSSWKLARIAAIGLLAAALGLAGCGRKAGLDPPPSAAISAPADGAAPAIGAVEVNGAMPGSAGAPAGGVTAASKIQGNRYGQMDFDPITGKPIAPIEVERKSFFLDFLVN